jgi:hypothetical protein
MYGDFPAKTTLRTPYIPKNVWFWPTLQIPSNSHLNKYPPLRPALPSTGQEGQALRPAQRPCCLCHTDNIKSSITLLPVPHRQVRAACVIRTVLNIQVCTACVIQTILKVQVCAACVIQTMSKVQVCTARAT